HPEQIAAATGDGHAATGVAALANQGDGLREIPRARVGKGFHDRAPVRAVSAATSLSRVIGRSFIRTPVAFATALATAAGAGTLLDSPMLFAPNGPNPSSDSMKITSISGASRCVEIRAP